jgi:hypothetical protein
VRPRRRDRSRPIAYYLLRIPLDGIDHFMLELDADGTPRREIGLDSSGRVMYATADDHGSESRCIWHHLFGWELEPFIADDAEPLTGAQFDATWQLHTDRISPPKG